ncbi:MAG: hypothetical protein GEU80_04225 [Dehalococcoidia bacterium]|nr:hypothetical protein [Dehalococcoidia bacterium]
MSVSPTVLLVRIAIGMPVLLLAIGVLYHAWVIRQQQAVGSLEDHVRASATSSSDELVGELHRAVRDMQGQLGRQRESLGSLLSEGAQRPRREPVPAAAPAAAPAMPAHLEAMIAATEAAAPMTAPVDMRASVRQLVAEGLSDRAIARRLRVGLEEVRLARARVGSPS